jgi:glycerol-3-phosphate O-acyltransferase/dihydroxyacetone phosphate acyltransferase
MTYAIVRGLARLLLAVFYRRLEVHGVGRVPPHGPLVIAANHHNALVDALLVIATIPRRLAPLAKASLFAHPLIAPFLWLAGAIMVHRRQESEDGVARNEQMFAATTAALRSGGAILIFPEGVSQPEPRLLPLRTGVARLTLDAEATTPGLGVTVLPVGLVFHRPAEFRTGRAVVVVGEPVIIDDLVEQYRHAPAAAVHELTDRIAVALRALIVEAHDSQTLRLLEVAHDLWKKDEPEPSGAERLAWMQEAVRRWNTLSPDLRGRVERLRRELERYDKDVGVTDGAPTPGRRQALRDGVFVALGLPLALTGIALHGLGYRATSASVTALRPEPDTSATYQLAAGLLLFPLSWLLEGIVVARAGGPWAVALFAVLLVPTGFFALTWRERLHRFRHEMKASARGVVRGDVGAARAARRQWLRDELVTLARLTASASGRAESGR